MTAAPPPLIHQRCWHHPSREAVVRCPECRRFYCRECVTEHGGRMMCAECVAILSRVDAAPVREPLGGWVGLALIGLVIAWLFFYYIGASLARMPAEFFGPDL